jgi:hypothetical protein
MLILKANVADKKKQSFFKITKSVNYFWSDMKDAKIRNPNFEIRNNDQNRNVPMTKTKQSLPWTRSGNPCSSGLFFRHSCESRACPGLDPEIHVRPAFFSVIPAKAGIHVYRNEMAEDYPEGAKYLR